jgi:hypothetical protein
MSGDEKGQCMTIYRLDAYLKAISEEKWSIGNLFFKSSFSQQMIQVASTAAEFPFPACLTLTRKKCKECSS